MDDRELNALLQEWHAPRPPARLRGSVFPKSAPWWLRVWRAQIRIPVPLAAGLVLLLLLGYWQSRPTPPSHPVRLVTFRDLQPVKELKPRIIRRQYE
jgi:hypothetical protein